MSVFFLSCSFVSVQMPFTSGMTGANGSDEESTWDDVTDVNNLLTKAVDFLTNTALMMSNTIKVTAVDLHFSDKEIRSFRICRNAVCHSKPHGITMTKPLTKLSIDLLKPQNTKITLGDTRLTLTDVNNQQQSNTQNRIESAEKDIEDNRTNVTEVKNQMVIQRTEIVNTCNEIFMSALKEYVVTSNFEEFRSTLKSELEVFAEGITGRVSQTEEDIRNVNGDLQAKFTEITKYFTFDINGLTIGQVDNPNKVVIDNDEIKIMVNNIPVQEFKADGTALIPILKITSILNLLGLQVEETETHINCDYVGVG